MEIKAIGFFNHLGREKTISMGLLENNLHLINRPQKIYQYMCPIYKDMEVEVVFNPILMRDMAMI